MPLQVKYATNIRESRVLYADGSFRRTYVFGVKGNAAIINTHALGNEDVVRVDVCSKAGSFKGDSNMFSSLISRKHRVDLGGDVTVIFLSGVSFKDCIVHIAGNDVLLGRPKALLNDISLRCRKEQRKQIVKDSKFKTTYTLVNPITYEFPDHKSGCCGLPLWVQPNTWALYGIHSGGTAGDSLSYAATFTRPQIEEAISLLASRGLMEVYSQSEFHDRVTLTTPNHKSPVYFQDI
jgi:hypothetical protein